jgi:virulence factor Mce-like protein
MRNWRRICAVLVTLLLLAPATVGCGVTLESIPIPDGQSGPKQKLHIEFASVLNIPSGAKVLLDGAPIGRLDSVTLGERTATATVEVSQSARLPVETRAELRQGTILGDLYMALIIPPNASQRYLRPGDTIPLAQTSPPDNVETVMISAGQLINGGVMTRVQKTIRELNAAVPPNPREITELTSNVTRQLVEAGRATDIMSRLLTGGAKTLDEIARNAATIDRVLTIGPDRFKKMQELFLNIVVLISDLRALTKPGADLLVQPTYRDLKSVVAALDPMVATLAEIDRSLTTNGELIRDLVAKKLTPFFTGASEVNIVNAKDKSGRAVALADFLRAIGVY